VPVRGSAILSLVLMIHVLRVCDSGVVSRRRGRGYLGLVSASALAGATLKVDR
jgi:hypothetical protein